MTRHLLPLLLLIALSACESWQKIPPGTVKLSDKAEVATSKTWSGQGDRDGFIWTQDGPGMDTMFFHLGIKDGKTLFESQDLEKNHNFILKLMNRQPDQISFRFSKTMTEWEIVEFFTTSWGKLAGDVPVKVEAMAPSSLDGHPGIRFQYSYTPKDELRRRGMGVAAVVDDKLYLVHYLGSAIYHFDKNKAEAEQVIASLKIKKG